MSITFSTSVKKERAILVGVDSKSTTDAWPIKSSMEELSALTSAAGASVVYKITQRLNNPSSSCLFTTRK